MNTRITDCGMANLLGAILGGDTDLIKTRLGIPLPYRKCPQCGEYIKSGHKKFCSCQCSNAYTHIWLECPECGELFQRYQSFLLARATKPLAGNGKLQERFYCSSKCLGKHNGRNYGFTAHPENAGHGRHGGGHRKWNWGLVLHLQRETGYGSLRLGRLTGVPKGTVEQILRESRK